MAQRASVSFITQTYTNLLLTAYRPTAGTRKGEAGGQSPRARGNSLEGPRRIEIDQKLTRFGKVRGPWPEVPESGKTQDVVFGMDRGAWK